MKKIIKKSFEIYRKLKQDNNKKESRNQSTTSPIASVAPEFIEKHQNVRDIKFSFPQDNATKLRILFNEANKSDYYKEIIPSLLIPEEKRMLHLISQHYYQGEGHILDAGVCLGGCTDAIAQGLNDNKNLETINKQIWVYEWGQIENYKYLQDFIDYNCKIHVPFGESFIHITKNCLDKLPNQNLIKFYPGDVVKQEFPDKIEVMFLDLCKSNELNFFFQKMFSKMIPNKSILIHQDYIHDNLPWMRITMGYLKDYFEFVGCTRVHSVAWLLKKEIPQEVLNINPYDTFGLDELLEMHGYWNKYLNKEQIETVNGALKYLYRDKGTKV